MSPELLAPLMFAGALLLIFSGYPVAFRSAARPSFLPESAWRPAC